MLDIAALVAGSAEADRDALHEPAENGAARDHVVWDGLNGFRRVLGSGHTHDPRWAQLFTREEAEAACEKWPEDGGLMAMTLAEAIAGRPRRAIPLVENRRAG